jgi:hypothetical protein
VYDVVADEGGTLTDLLSVSHSFVDERLAGLYGTDITAQETPDGDGVRRVEFDPDRRAGILTQPGLLATHASPTESSLVLRGKFIRERLLCGTIAPPPGDVDTDLPPPSPDLSPRERWEEHLTDPTCASCHLLMDPLGFAFEHYDAIGRWRDQIGPWNVDAAGELTGTDVDGPFDGPVELSAKLARSQIAADCFVRQWMLYAFARNLGDDRDLVDDLASQWGGPDRAVRTLLHDIVTSDAFRYRKVQP